MSHQNPPADLPTEDKDVIAPDDAMTNEDGYDDEEDYDGEPYVDPLAHLTFAHTGIRTLAYLIDIIPIAIVIFIIHYYFFGLDDAIKARLAHPKDLDIYAAFLEKRNHMRHTSFFAWVAYCSIMDSSRYQGTFGKWLMKIKVVNRYGEPLTPLAASLRNGWKALSFYALYLGFVWILFDKKKQGWHDKLAHTYVVKR